MVLDTWMADLVMPMANMLLAAVRAGGYRHDEQSEQDHPPAPGPHSDRVCTAIEPGAGPGQPRVHARQYGLTEEARRLGWDPERILVIDADLGISGRSATGRLGFQDLVHRVPPVGVRDLIDGVRYVHEVQEVDSWGRALQNRRRGS